MNLKTIAELSGVSTATVSNVINGNYNKVSEETRQRVEEIIRQTDYKPAGGPRRKAGIRNIGLIVPHVSRETGFMINHYGTYALAALEDLADNNNARIMVLSGKPLTQVTEMISDGILDGALVMGAFEGDATQFQKTVHIPVVYIDTYTNDPHIVTVNVDDYRGGYLMARYLIARGHRKIAMASPDYREGVIHERYCGFCDACQESDVSFAETDIFMTDTKYRNGVNVGQDIALSGKGYTAIASMSDDMAFWMAAGIRQCGIHVPDDLSIIGFDGIPEGECFLYRLTSVEQNITRKINVAGEYLLRMMDGDPVVAHDVLPVQIKEGDTVKILS